MAAPSLDQIRKQLQENENQGKKSSGSYDLASYPFWEMKDDDQAVIRFLPDGDPDNTFFWRERQIIRLPFNGIKGETDKPITVQVPCMEMYSKTCPILSEVRQWYKQNDDEIKKMASQYWKKRSYIFQGFVVDDPLNPENYPRPENPIRRFIINPTIFNIIKDTLMDPEMDEIPVDYDNGRDFKIKKKRQGQYADYTSSSWSIRSRSLSDEERKAVDEYGLFVLKDYLPNMPSDKDIETIQKMFEASVDGEPFDNEKFAPFTPKGGYQQQNTESNTKSSSTQVKKNNQSKESSKQNEESSDDDNESKLKNKKKQSEVPNDEESDDSENTSNANSSESGKMNDPSEVLQKLRQRKSG